MKIVLKIVGRISGEWVMLITSMPGQRRRKVSQLLTCKKEIEEKRSTDADMNF